MEDVEAALKEVAAGTDQKEDDLAPYCTPAYIEMEAGSSWITLGNATKAITTFEDSRSRWSDHKQVRDHALCLARLATAYALSGEGEQACIIAEEVMALTQAVGSGRVLAQLKMLRRSFEKWSHDPFIADFRARLDIVTGTPRFH